MPLTYIYFDDVALIQNNSYCGELLAIKEYNERNNLRLIEYHQCFEKYRIFKKALWTKQLYFLHVLDHPKRYSLESDGSPRIIENPYIEYTENKEKFYR